MQGKGLLVYFGAGEEEWVDTLGGEKSQRAEEKVEIRVSWKIGIGGYTENSKNIWWIPKKNKKAENTSYPKSKTVYPLWHGFRW